MDAELSKQGSGKKLTVALQVADDPSLLRSDFGVKDEMGRMIPVEELQRCFMEYRGTVYLLRDIESGIITLSLTEYRALPAMFVDMWHVFKLYAAERRDADMKRMWN